MLVYITSVVSTSQKIYYNEQKVTRRQAECIYAANYLKDVDHLSLDDKRQRFNDLLELNHRPGKKGNHIVLEFPPGEDHPNDKMIAITASYMQRIGYRDQPYLVYRHRDTAIPHVHVVTTIIRPDGRTIRDDFMALRISEPARKAVELEFGLAKAGGNKRAWQPATAPVRRIDYGKLPNLETLASTLHYVLHNFRYRSVAELNAILRLYNLTAKTGRPGSRLQQLGGLLYQVIGDNGKSRGAPLKASSLPFKPTLSWLRQKFDEHKTLNPATIRNTRVAFEASLRERPANAPAFQDALRRNQLALTLTSQTNSTPDGTTNLLLVNLADKTVLNITELGPNYDLPAIHNRLSFDPLQLNPAIEQHKQQQKQSQQKKHL